MSTNKPALLISACLLGEAVRYDGQAKGQAPDQQAALAERFRLIPTCPECAGGLPVPRPAAEVCGGDGAAVWQGTAQVMTADGQDVTAAFVRGAEHSLALAQQHACHLALLKANSPSCGNRQIYDGSFSGQRQPGEGVCSSLLHQHGIKIFNEAEIEELLHSVDNKI
ncbi:DUF523 domain-containing protein [Aquitalea denitrificans]|uniref:DUF523 domain-containing protein n=1 Tax=Aquitalea denitrificans TaxID=519081 RepID=UPI00196A8B3B|nr:DUF523 domain-containing protein [Aquitalea denitrificans]